MDPKAKRRTAGAKAPIKRIRHLLLRSLTNQPGSAKAIMPVRRSIKDAVAGPPLSALSLA